MHRSSKHRTADRQEAEIVYGMQADGTLLHRADPAAKQPWSGGLDAVASKQEAKKAQLKLHYGNLLMPTPRVGHLQTAGSRRDYMAE